MLLLKQLWRRKTAHLLTGKTWHIFFPFPKQLWQKRSVCWISSNAIFTVVCQSVVQLVESICLSIHSQHKKLPVIWKIIEFSFHWDLLCLVDKRLLLSAICLVCSGCGSHRNNPVFLDMKMDDRWHTIRIISKFSLEKFGSKKGALCQHPKTVFSNPLKRP